jgi:hypothetical protein
MEKPKGYFYDNNSLRLKVRGFKELSPFARHAVKDILDLIWESESLSIEDNKELLKYIGFNEKQWKDIKIELTSLNNKFLVKENNDFKSPWLNSQSEKTPKILKEYKEYSNSYDEIDEIEEINTTFTDKKDKTIEQEDTIDNFDNNKKHVLFKEKNNSLGASTRANIVSNKILNRYANK